MPAAAKPKPKPKAPPALVQSAGNQADFAAPAAKLAEELGWKGEPDWVANDIMVRDAQRFIAKTMHEHFQAAARGLSQPDYKAACDHLAVDNPTEQAAIDQALKAAYAAGKGAEVKGTPATIAGVAANIEVSAGAGLGKLAQAEGKAR
ncbi:MAG TPA: hypothetical protein VJN18_32750 [Polyangiaceae bacterium]|nr:hypothetical protein [Polyangiaceae bacterium]